MQYRTSRQSRTALENITPGRRSRRAAVVIPSGTLYRVARPGDNMGQLVRGESADQAVAKYRELFGVAASVALVVSDR